MNEQFELSARYYDAFYSQRPYRDDVAALQALIARHCPRADRVLDVACGSHEHGLHFDPRYQVDRLDNNATFLEIARRKTAGRPGPAPTTCTPWRTSRSTPPTTPSSACSAPSATCPTRMPCAGRCTPSAIMAPGGVIVVEPWLSAQQLGAFQSSQLVCADGLEIARIARHRVDGDKLTLWLHWPAGRRCALLRRRASDEPVLERGLPRRLRTRRPRMRLRSGRSVVTPRALCVPPAGRRMSAVVTAAAGETGLSAWDACFRPQRLFPSLERDESCDFPGDRAGYAGLSAARAAATPGARIIVLEAARRARRRRAQCRLHDRRHPRPGLRRLRR